MTDDRKSMTCPYCHSVNTECCWMELQQHGWKCINCERRFVAIQNIPTLARIDVLESKFTDIASAIQIVFVTLDDIIKEKARSSND